MTNKKLTVIERHKKLLVALRAINERREQIREQLVALRYDCSHPNLQTLFEGGPGGVVYETQHCKDCGYFVD